jgi:signal transduction histidine kinase
MYYWKNLRQSVESDMNTAFSHQVRQIADNVSENIQVYQNVLGGSSGLFKVHSGLTEDEWKTFHSPYDIKQKFPEVQSISVSRYLHAADLPAYFQRRVDQGEPDFAITPSGDRQTYVPVTFEALYRDSMQSSRGFDELTDPVRKEAIEHTIESGNLTMSGQITTTTAKTPSFILYMPVYKNGMPSGTAAERQTALLGFVSVTVDMKAFIDRVLASNQNPNIAVRVADAGTFHKKGYMYTSANFAAISGMNGVKVQDSQGQVYGHTWHVTFAASPELLSAREREMPQQALWRGLVTCIFFAGLVWYLITDRERTYARQKQEEVQTAKDDLLSLASHQLRTPATVVKQYVGMLLQGYAGELTERQLHMLTNAYESNERQLEIINQLLYVARLDAGRITLHMEQVDLTKLLRSVIADQDETLKARGQRLSFKPPKRPQMITADPHYIRMVFENLLSNAIKYTPEKGAISFVLHHDETMVAVHITDNGVGIDPAVQATIFDKFTRVDNELSTDVNGSGVGLYLTKEIIELHHGSIEVQSVAGGGSTFIVSLPINPADPEEDGAA